jgi:hypothetical protein
VRKKKVFIVLILEKKNSVRFSNTFPPASQRKHQKHIANRRVYSVFFSKFNSLTLTRNLSYTSYGERTFLFSLIIITCCSALLFVKNQQLEPAAADGSRSAD